MFENQAGSFNTQPPEGGWKIIKPEYNGTLWFQHTAARRRLGILSTDFVDVLGFQHTAARRRLVGQDRNNTPCEVVSTHSRPKAAGGIELISGTT